VAGVGAARLGQPGGNGRAGRVAAVTAVDDPHNACVYELMGKLHIEVVLDCDRVDNPFVHLDPEEGEGLEEYKLLALEVARGLSSAMHGADRMPDAAAPDPARYKLDWVPGYDNKLRLEFLG
jgi:hypothetical protein